MVKVGIIGATGYTGVELLRILQNHPAVEICYISSETHAGQMLADVYPHFKNHLDLSCSKLSICKIIDLCDLVFIALPHGQALNISEQLLKAGKKVIDLGADFRLQNPTDYEKWYQHTPATPSLLQQAVYGLAEIGNRQAIAQAKLIANPGCYATAAILALAPALQAGIANPHECIIDGKSGVSGAGRALSLDSHYCEVTENFKAYNIAGLHRHTPEIEQALSNLINEKILIQFTPHLVPMKRGLFITAYLKLTTKMLAAEIEKIYLEYYQNEPFIRIMNNNELPQTKNVVGSNYCDIALRVDERTQRLIVVSVIDNLVKGASGQAIQNMNLMQQLPETMGLHTLTAIYP